MNQTKSQRRHPGFTLIEMWPARVRNAITPRAVATARSRSTATGKSAAARPFRPRCRRLLIQDTARV